MKRFLSIAIILMMVLSLVQLPAMAATEGTDYIIVDDDTVRILTQDGWTQQFTTYNVAGKTIYLDGDIEIGATGATLNCNLIGKEGGVDVTLKSLPMFSAVAANVTVSNLNLKPYENTEYTFSKSYQGILVKEIRAKDVTVSGITNYISCVNTGNSMGIIGATHDGTTITISDCVNYGDFSAGASTSFAGGILGAARKASDIITIENCVNYGDISASTGCGGIYSGSYADATVTITGCVNEGTISTNADASVGGIVGSTRGNATITDCVNKGSVSGTKFIGGIAGGYTTADSGDIYISDSVNTGSISGTDRYIGGILGSHFGDATIIKCANIGTVTTTDQFAGGIAGQLGNSTVSECYNSGNITAGTNYAGGIAGNNASAYSMTIENCYNSGNVKADKYASGIMYSMGLRTHTEALNQKLDSVYNSGVITANSNVFNVVSIVGLGDNETYDVKNIYYVDEKGGSEKTTNVCKYDSTEQKGYRSLGTVSYTKLSTDILPEGLDSTIWTASEDGYPILKNNLPKNADGTDKEYYVVNLTNGANGEALKSAETYVEKGNTYTLSLVPATGYKVDTVTAGGTQCEGEGDVYEISVNGDTEVVVTYAEKTVESPTSASELYAVDAENYEIYAFAKYSIVEDNSATDFGILLSFEETDDFTLGNTSLRKFSAKLGEGAKGANENGQYGIKLYGNLITNDGTYYCVPYVVYEDGTVCYGSDMTVKK